MKIEINPKFTKEQRELLEKGSYLTTGLLPKAIGVPSPFSINKPPFEISKEIFELMVIPFDSIDMNKRGLLRYGKKYKPTYFFESSRVFFEGGQIFSSSNGEHGVGGFESKVDFAKEPKTFLIHIGICNHKFVIVMAHKDHVDVSNVFGGATGGDALFETHDNDFPYPVNADWHGLPGSWEYHQAMRSGKSVVTPNLINSMVCEITISECDDYVPVAYMHDYFKSRDIYTAPKSSISTIAQSINNSFNVHDMISDFLVKCRTNNILESGYIASQNNVLPASSSWSGTPPATPATYATYAVYEPPANFSFGDLSAGISNKKNTSPEKNAGKNKKSTNNKATIELEQEINVLKNILSRRDEEVNSLREVADKYQKENESILSTSGLGAENAARRAAEKYNGGYNYGTDLLTNGRSQFAHIFEFIHTYVSSNLEGNQKSLVSALSDNVFISILTNENVLKMEIKGFDGNAFHIEVEEKTKTSTKTGKVESRYFRLYQLVNMNNLVCFLTDAVSAISELCSESDKDVLLEKDKNARRFILYLNSLMKYETDCLKSMVSTNRVFMLEEDY